MGYFTIFLLFIIFQAQAVEFKFSSSMSDVEKSIINKAVTEVLSKAPDQFVLGLPKTIHIKLKSYKGEDSIPDLCSKKDVKFTYGKYRYFTKTLTLNKAIVKELAKGPEKSKKIDCQHKSLYTQAQATILHELTHAYDRNSGRPSKDSLFKNITHFSSIPFLKGSKNSNAMRSVDDYELKNSEEAFAVNMEYFILDPEFACRKPLLFKHYKELFGIDPYPHRTCKLNYTVMAATQFGLIPYDVDPSRVYRIDYLLASKGHDLASSFGHSMFRIVLCAPKHTNPQTGVTVPATPNSKACLKDKLFHLVASFRANNQGATLNYMKGIFGGYPSMLFMMPLGDVLEQYNHSELRDLISYPLKFSQDEKIEFLQRLTEQHWDYRGNYKFITNNCAGESLNSLKVILNEREKIGKGDYYPDITPKTVLNVLAQYNLVDLKDESIDFFLGDVTKLIKAYSLAYENEKEVKRKTFTKFIYESSPEDRLKTFTNTLSTFQSAGTLREQLIFQNDQLLKIASFSVIEQQVIRTKANELKKKLADISSDKKKIEKYPDIFKEFNEAKDKSIDTKEASSSGYGIPQPDEIITSFDENLITEQSEKLFKQSQKILTTLFPKETGEINEIAKNLEEMNKARLPRRSEYRKNLMTYVILSIRELAKTDEGKTILHEALSGDTTSFRENLGHQLITEIEMTDARIIQLIRSHF